MYNLIYKFITELEAVTDSHEQAQAALEAGKRVINRNDMGCLAEAKGHAYNAAQLTGKPYLPVDHGPSRSPRFDIVRAPEVGDEVSYAFNGDYYPCGKVVKVSDSRYRVVTDTGDVFYRRKTTATWKRKGGTWSLVHGHVDKRNPSF